MSWLKRFFKKTISLPLWFFILGRPVSWKDFEEYEATIDKIARSLYVGKSVVVKINGKPSLVEKVDKEITIRELTPDEIKLVL